MSVSACLKMKMKSSSTKKSVNASLMVLNNTSSGRLRRGKKRISRTKRSMSKVRRNDSFPFRPDAVSHKL